MVGKAGKQAGKRRRVIEDSEEDEEEGEGGDGISVAVKEEPGMALDGEAEEGALGKGPEAGRGCVRRLAAVWASAPRGGRGVNWGGELALLPPRL